ncbi:putative Histidine kinase [Syntrophobacter sp. SbD1]|nr:putative Histidine kinase [Syntrophobacter sp. SbD1]
MLFDECGMIVDANRASLDLLGMTDSASLGKFNIFDDSSVPERALEQLCKGQTIRYETRFDFEKARDIDLLRTPKSGVFFFDVQITPLMQNQIIGGYLLQVQDLTVRKRAEQALEISHQFLEAANRSATLSSLIESFAILARQFTGCSVVNIRIPDESRSTVCENCESIEYESIAMVPIRFGDSILGLIHIADAKQKEQKKQNMLPGQTLQVLERAAMELGTAIQRLRAADELRRAHDELEMRVKERTLDLASSNDRLQKEIEDRTLAQEALSKSAEDLKLFAYSIMHDLKSPTIGLYGLTKLLHRQYAGNLDEKGMNYCEQILRASEYCSSLVDQINIFIAAKESPLNIETVKLNDILRTVIEEFSAKMSVRQIRCIQPDSDVEIRVDRLSMIRVLTNLVDNALKYGGDVLSEIRIGYEETGDYCILSVSDDGVGMNRKDCEEIFGPFQRSGNSAGITGTGLGLNIVREIAKRHGGYVQVVPEPERGMVFRISIGKSL